MFDHLLKEVGGKCGRLRGGDRAQVAILESSRDEHRQGDAGRPALGALADRLDALIA